MATLKTGYSIPRVITGEIQHEVLTRFRAITANEKNYLNTSIQAVDELQSFYYTTPDSGQLIRGDMEEIETTFAKERTAKLEYQDDALYARSTASDYKQLSITPHTSTITKLLELRPLDREDWFAKMYIRFVTESIWYNVALGYADDVLKLEYGEISAYLTIKELLILFLYCEGQAHHYFEKIVDGKTYKREVKIPKYAYLCMPYKKQFNPLEDYYKWHNLEQYNPHVLMIIPDELTLKSEILPEFFKGIYSLTNPDAKREEWVWMNSYGSTIRYGIEDDGVGRWLFSGSDTNSSVVTYSTVRIPYWNWLCWHPDLVYTDETGKDLAIEDADIQVTNFHYAIDDMMPNYHTSSYVDYEYPDDSLVHLIDRQATNYIEMYKEYLKSGWSRQHAAFLQILDDRTFRGRIELNLSEYDTFHEHITNSPELATILAGFDTMSEATKDAEYTYLADLIIKLLYPIESDYLVDASLELGGKLTRLKDLIVDLCSYNVAWVTDPSAFGNAIIDCFGSNTLDVLKSVYGMEDVSRITETEVYTIFQLGIVDKWCYDALYPYGYIWDATATTYFLVYLIQQQYPELDSELIRQAVNNYKDYVESGIEYTTHGILTLAIMDQIYARALELKNDPFQTYTRPTLIEIPEPHCCCCIDHQYIINSRIEENISTVIAPVETGDNDAALGQVFTTVVNLADADTPHALFVPNLTQLRELMEKLVDTIGVTGPGHDQTGLAYDETTGVYTPVTYHIPGRNDMIVNLCNAYNSRFRDSTFTSLLEYDSSYDYHQPTGWAIVDTKPIPIKA